MKNEFDREYDLGMAMKDTFCLREMRSEDLPQVLSIENNTQASPWGRLSFEESMTKSYRCRVIGMNSDDENNTAYNHCVVVAYHVVCEIVDELHILNVVTAPQHQGQGLGHMLMADIVEFAEKRNLSKLFLEVRAVSYTHLTLPTTPYV